MLARPAVQAPAPCARLVERHAFCSAPSTIGSVGRRSQARKWASVGLNLWQSTQMAQRLRAEGVNMLEFRATTQNFSPAILELDAAMRPARIRHDGDPVLAWCVGNVVGRPDRRGNLYSAKQRPEQKIDAAVALIMAVGRAMAEDTTEGALEDFLRDPLFA